VEEILSRPEIADLLKAHPRNVVVEAIRKGLGRLREEILRKEELPHLGESLFTFEYLYPLFQKEIDHPELEILDDEEVLKSIRHSREHYDGSGYPGHLKGNLIPLRG
jgi:hypothetical protein